MTGNKSDGLVKLRPEGFKRLLQVVYNQGVEDGAKDIFDEYSQSSSNKSSNSADWDKKSRLDDIFGEIFKNSNNKH